MGGITRRQCERKKGRREEEIEMIEGG